MDELAAYLADPCEELDDHEVLKWWYNNRHLYPRLHVMALSYLMSPGMYQCTLQYTTLSDQLP